MTIQMKVETVRERLETFDRAKLLAVLVEFSERCAYLERSRDYNSLAKRQARWAVGQLVDITRP